MLKNRQQIVIDNRLYNVKKKTKMNWKKKFNNNC